MKTEQQLYERAEELTESFLNGNRSHVLTELSSEPLAILAIIMSSLDVDDCDLIKHLLVDRAIERRGTL